MSWLARSIADTLRLDDDEEQQQEPADDGEAPDDAAPRSTLYDAVPPEDPPTLSSEDHHRLSDSDENDDDNNLGRGGVKEDLSELKDSFTRQLWGVASFLAPPPPPPPPPPLPTLHRRSDEVLSESKSDEARSSDGDDDEYEVEEFDEIGETANFSQQEDYYTSIVEEAIGITEEVLAFARNIAHHPETWLDFTLSEDEEFDDFDISDVQYKHVLAIEHLAPRLAALRIELCPAHMTEGYFWMVYFVLLHSRLNKHDADLLSSPEIVEARAMWMQELHKQTKEESYLHNKESSDSPRENFNIHPYEDAHIGNASEEISPFESTMHHTRTDHVIEKHPFNEIEFIDKSVIREDPAPNLEEKVVVSSYVGMPNQDIDDDDDDDDDWVKDDDDLIGYCTSIVGNEEDISFSDLEDDIDCSMPIKSKIFSAEWNTTNKTS